MEIKTTRELCDEANLKIDAFVNKLHARLGKLTVKIVIKDEAGDEYLLAFMRNTKDSNYTVKIKLVNEQEWHCVTAAPIADRALAMLHFRELYEAGVRKEAELRDLLTKSIEKLDADEELK